MRRSWACRRRSSMSLRCRGVNWMVFIAYRPATSRLHSPRCYTQVSPGNCRKFWPDETITLPHVARDFFDAGQRPALHLFTQIPDDELLLAAFQDIQHAPVGMVDDHRYELAMLF